MSAPLRPCVGEHAELSYAYQTPPCGRTVEVLAEPDADGMVRVAFVHTFLVPSDELEFWGDE